MMHRIMFFPIIHLLLTLCVQAYGEAASLSARKFLGANISGYSHYLSVEEFSELRLLQDALLYCERNDEEAVFNEIAARYKNILPSKNGRTRSFLHGLHRHGGNSTL